MDEYRKAFTKQLAIDHLAYLKKDLAGMDLAQAACQYQGGTMSQQAYERFRDHYAYTMSAIEKETAEQTKELQDEIEDLSGRLKAVYDKSKHEQWVWFGVAGLANVILIVVIFIIAGGK